MQLGTTLRRAKKYRESEVAIKRSLLINQRYVGVGHPRFAGPMYAMAVLYLDQMAWPEGDAAAHGAEHLRGKLRRGSWG